MFAFCRCYDLNRKQKKRDASGKKIKRTVWGTFDAEALQRIAYAVQVAVRSWNSFAKCFNYDTIADMLGPFLLFSIDKESSLPSVQATLEFNKRSHPSNRTSISENDAFVEIQDIPRQEHAPEEYARQMLFFKCASEFLKDVETITSSRRLHEIQKAIESLPRSTEEPDAWPEFKVFHANGREPAERFHEIIISNRSLLLNTNIVRSILRKHDGGETSSSPSAPTTGEIPSAPALPNQDIGGKTSQEIERAQEIMQFELDAYIRMHACGFEEIVDCDFDETGNCNTLHSTAQLVLCDPPWNVRNEDHDKLDGSQMKPFIDVVSKVLRPGGHAIIFCSVQQFNDWSSEARKHKTPDSRGKPELTFSVDLQPMSFHRDNSWVQSNPARSSCALHSNYDLAMHMKKNGLPYEQEKTIVNYRHFGHVKSTSLPYNNTMDNVKGPLQGERIMIRGNKGRSRQLRAEQKGLAFMMELIERFSQPGDQVVDLCAGTFSTGLACLLLPQYRSFVGCDNDLACVQVAKSHVYGRLANFIVHDKPGFPVTTKLLESSKTVLNGEGTTVVEADWRPPANYPPYQYFPRHILLYASSTFQTQDYINYFGVPIQNWNKIQSGNFESIPWEELRRAEATSLGLIIMQSEIKNSNAGLGVFAARDISKGEVVGYYYGTIVYHDLWNRKQVTKTYGDGVLGVTVGDYRKYGLMATVETSNFPAVKDRIEDGKLAIHIVGAKFCVMTYINSPQYGRNDDDYERFIARSLPNPRKANVAFIENTAHNPQELVNYRLIPVEALCEIHSGDELYVDYNVDHHIID